MNLIETRICPISEGVRLVDRRVTTVVNYQDAIRDSNQLYDVKLVIKVLFEQRGSTNHCIAPREKNCDGGKQFSSSSSSLLLPKKALQGRTAYG
ncbi:hypothetical protein CEXT_447861 [Caerostris extrusa]|uniref:Uncharacterized protein n=1 Tax=Caerostris extrusa TaxID=172846 RepID=A0AAV4V9F1_CAEEX|nr:hypothetical protein CEXT_447861 [Caerostris extrusa]